MCYIAAFQALAVEAASVLITSTRHPCLSTTFPICPSSRAADQWLAAQDVKTDESTPTATLRLVNSLFWLSATTARIWDGEDGRERLREHLTEHLRDKTALSSLDLVQSDRRVRISFVQGDKGGQCYPTGYIVLMNTHRQLWNMSPITAKLNPGRKLRAGETS